MDWQGRKSTRSEYALSAFKSELESFVSAYGGNWSVYIKDLKTGNVVNINDREMYPASTIKAFFHFGLHNIAGPHRLPTLPSVPFSHYHCQNNRFR